MQYGISFWDVLSIPPQRQQPHQNIVRTHEKLSSNSP